MIKKGLKRMYSYNENYSDRGQLSAATIEIDQLLQAIT
jgi:hypothetical protein